MITDSRPIWDASLAEILSQPATPGTRASATDIPGVNLEWMATGAYPAGAWFGDCGQPTLAQLYALPTAYLAFGARASVNGVQYTYGAAGCGWRLVGGAQTIGSTALVKFPVSTDTRFPWSSGGYITNPANNNLNTRSCIIPATDLAGMSVVFDNFGIVSSDDSAFTGEAITLIATMEIAGKKYPLTFSGARSFVLQPFARMESDFIGVLIPAYTKCYLRIRASGLTKYVPSVTVRDLNFGDGNLADATTTDLNFDTGITGYVSPGNGSPCVSTIFGWAKERKISLVGVGDSIVRGIGDSANNSIHNTYNDRAGGWVIRAGQGICGVGCMALSGETATGFAAGPSFARWRYAADYDVCVIGLGRNDVVGSKTLQQITDALTTIFNNAKSLGFSKIVLSTLWPYTSSTDSWATEENQTRINPTLDDAVSEWILANSLGADHVIDVRIGAANANGVWIVNGTTDGVHPKSGPTLAAGLSLRSVLGLS